MDSLAVTLYHNTYSICSIMVRQTLAIRGRPGENYPKLSIKEVVVDIFNEEQFSEHFLSDINALGQVRFDAILKQPRALRSLLNVPIGSCNGIGLF